MKLSTFVLGAFFACSFAFAGSTARLTIGGTIPRTLTASATNSAVSVSGNIPFTIRAERTTTTLTYTVSSVE